MKARLPSAGGLAAAWPHLRGNRLALAGAALLASAAAAALLAPCLAPHDPYAPAAVTTSDIYAPPDPGHWLGTDDAGRDVLSNLLYGSRVSLIVGLFAAFISVGLGGAIGLIAGFAGGRLEGFLMRLTDVFLVIPDLPLAVVLVALTRPSLINIILVIGLVGWTSTARLVRAQTLAVKHRKFVLRARAVGAGSARLLTRHILPLVLPLVLVNAVLVVSLAILEESALSFLGLSDPTRLSWGQMLHFAFMRGAMSAGAWWALVPPGLGIAYLVLGCALLGQGLERFLGQAPRSHHLSRGPALPRENRAAADRSGAIPLLEVEDLQVDFLQPPRPPLRAVDRVGFSLGPGERLGIVGESGCGKSTLLLSLLRLLPDSARIAAGQVRLEGRDLLSMEEGELAEVRWKEISLVFQGAMNSFNPVRPVGGQIGEAIRRHEPAASRADRDRRVGELLELVGLGPERRHQYPHQYSGGMRQRAALAMALACRPRILCADEPTTALDLVVQAQILELLSRLGRQLGLAVLLVTHDLGVVAELCDTALVMYAGTQVECAGVEDLFTRPRHPYTQGLLRAFPDLSRPGAELSSIPGLPPRLDELPPGCCFAPRCPLAFDRCHGEPPALHALGPRHQVRCHLADPAAP